MLATRTMRDIGWTPTYVLMIQAPRRLSSSSSSARPPHRTSCPDAVGSERQAQGQVLRNRPGLLQCVRQEVRVEPSYLPAGASAAGSSYQLAIEKAGSIGHGEGAPALLSMKMDTFYGPIAYTGPGIRAADRRETSIGRCSDGSSSMPSGNQVVVAPLNVAQVHPSDEAWNAR
jgi:hypothetical protein